MARRKTPITVTIKQELLDWIKLKISDYTFADYSHAVGKALQEMKERMEKKKV